MRSGTVPPQPAPAPAPHPPPAEFGYEGLHGRNPLGGTTFAAMSARLPSVLRRTALMAWEAERRAVLLLLGCQLLTGLSAALLLSCTARAMRHLFGAGPVSERLHSALPALVVISVAAAAGRIAASLSSYADGRITPRLTTAADSALVAAVCRAEASAYAEDGFTDRQEAAEMGVVRTHVMVRDATRFTAAVVRMVTASGVLTVLHPLLLPLLLLAVVPAGAGAVLSARVTYETHYAGVGDRTVRQMMRWWSTTSKYGDEVRANGMRRYLLFWYRTVSERIDARTLRAAPRMLRIELVSAAIGGVFLVATWTALAWLTLTGRIALPVAATAVVAVQTTLAALSQLVIHGAAMFHTSLYLADMRSFLDLAAEHAPKQTALLPGGPVREIRLTDVVHRYPGKATPAVDGVSLTLRRGRIVAVVGENGSGKSTLARLIARIHPAASGTVTWDGVDLATVAPDSVWAHTGLVPQNFAQWPLRVRENVTLGQPHGDDDGPVWEALDAVGMREAVGELPHGPDTLLAREVFGGTELSGGQWQRLACSRAFYRRPGLLILDEPTSQMDARGEHAILERIKAIACDRITVVITHQLENTRVADEIVVMRHGRIAEQGRYDELATAGGLFQELLTLSKDR
ncbi:ABC transporter ATP-binding protein [Streptomyces sp. NPDC046931]|uniref:ABC transporter ATP-binding protein n=1 Tax=Streptomyces sp. NPDC046931 TaxID=3154806 RepID=UPI0033F9013C